MRVATVVLAAGHIAAIRARPKQFETLGDSTMLQHAVRAFIDVDRVAEVWVVTSDEQEEATRALSAARRSPASCSAETPVPPRRFGRWRRSMSR